MSMRKLSGWKDKGIGAWLVALSSFQLYTAMVGIMEPRIQRGVFLLFILPVAFILFPATKKSSDDKIGVVNICLAFLSLLPPLYIIIFHERLTERIAFVDPVSSIELLLGGLMIILMLEAVRRVVANAMAMLIAVAIIYMFVAPYLPGIFYTKAPSFTDLVEMQYLITESGTFGMITGIAATFVALFVIFGAFIETTNTGRFFTNLACKLAGNSYGGPAKVAVLSSGLFGSISGVAAANVYATGVFTIPLMKRLGYQRRFAGAIEAAASTGGQLMPPIMGAGAFVMAEITGIAYIQIVIAATLGAILYYISLILRVHFTALKENLIGIGEEEILSYKQILKDSYLLIPIVFLVVLLVKGYSPFLSATAAIGATFFLSFVKKETMMTPRKMWQTLRLGGANMIMVALACAGAGMIVSIVTYTGLALGVATVITNWSGGHMLLALFLIMITTLILGMGLPCTPAYIIGITIGGPALLAMGSQLLTANLFVFYFAVLAGITPPVCIAAYCAATIADSKPLQTGFEAAKLAIVAFLIPYVFFFNKGLLMQGTILEIATVVIVMFIATVFFAAALSDYLFSRLGGGKRIVVLLIAVGITILAASPEIVNLLKVRIVVLLIFLAIIRELFYGRMSRSAAVMRSESQPNNKISG